MTAATVTCYRQEAGDLIEEHSPWVICHEKFKGLCCTYGSDCLDEQICHNPKDSAPGSSEYYIGLCTDATYKSPSCSSRCTDDNWGDVTYNFSTGLWACCGTNTGCNNPTNETFLAPPPQQLFAAASSQSATTAASTSISTSIPSATVTTTSTPSAIVNQTSSLNDGAKVTASTSISTSIPSATVTTTSTPSAIVNQTSSLNDGAKAVIGVGAALAALAITALLAWIILLRRRLRNYGQARNLARRRDNGMMNQGLPKEVEGDSVREHELSGYSRSYEMQGG